MICFYACLIANVATRDQVTIERPHVTYNTAHAATFYCLLYVDARVFYILFNAQHIVSIEILIFEHELYQVKANTL